MKEKLYLLALEQQTYPDHGRVLEALGVIGTATLLSGVIALGIITQRGKNRDLHETDVSKQNSDSDY
jgi:hypothetical protein